MRGGSIAPRPFPARHDDGAEALAAAEPRALSQRRALPADVFSTSATRVGFGRELGLLAHHDAAERPCLFVASGHGERELLAVENTVSAIRERHGVGDPLMNDALEDDALEKSHPRPRAEPCSRRGRADFRGFGLTGAPMGRPAGHPRPRHVGRELGGGDLLETDASVGTSLAGSAAS